MARTKDNYQVTGRTVDELVRNLNFLLQRLADRMDQIEGIRGTSSIESDLDMNLNRITAVGSGTSSTDAARRGDLLTEPLVLSSALTVQGDITAESDITAEGDIKVFDDSGELIHSLE